MSKLGVKERTAALKSLAGWTYDSKSKALVKEMTFANFRAAFAFLAEVALLAEKAGHHPDWSNVYNRVRIAMTTHDEGGVTEKDIDLARAIEAVLSR